MPSAAFPTWDNAFSLFAFWASSDNAFAFPPAVSPFSPALSWFLPASPALARDASHSSAFQGIQLLLRLLPVSRIDRFFLEFFRQLFGLVPAPSSSSELLLPLLPSYPSGLEQNKDEHGDQRSATDQEMSFTVRVRKTLRQLLCKTCAIALRLLARHFAACDSSSLNDSAVTIMSLRSAPSGT